MLQSRYWTYVRRCCVTISHACCYRCQHSFCVDTHCRWTTDDHCVFFARHPSACKMANDLVTCLLLQYIRFSHISRSIVSHHIIFIFRIIWVWHFPSHFTSLHWSPSSLRFIVNSPLLTDDTHFRNTCLGMSLLDTVNATSLNLIEFYNIMQVLYIIWYSRLYIYHLIIDLRTITQNCISFYFNDFNICPLGLRANFSCLV